MASPLVSSAPPPAPAASRTGVRLPRPIGSLLGRKRELALARTLLAEGARLLTLTGPGGVGKTRLALTLAGELTGDGSMEAGFVDLTPVPDPTLVPLAVAAAFGLNWDGRLPLPQALAATRLRGRPALLVVDNCEHVLAAAPLVGELLEALPDLVVMATSREPLRLRREQELPVAPLALPSAGPDGDPLQLMQNPCVALFVERARAVCPAFVLTPANARVVAEICNRLDGLPLAIELAAAQSRLLPPAALLARLGRWLDLRARAEDVPARHRTLHAAVDWSYVLLSVEDRALFRRVAVFVGGSTLETTAAVLEPGLDALEGLGSLVDKSLLHAAEQPDGEPRFRMLETVRAFALERLVEHGELEATRRRHAAFWLDWAEALEPRLWENRDLTVYDRFGREYDNLRAALSWCIEAGHAEAGLRLGAVLWLYWFGRSQFTEGRHWLTQLLAFPGGPHTARARVLGGMGCLALRQGDLAAVQLAAAEALPIAREVSDGRVIAQGLFLLGFVALGQADGVRAAERFGEAREVAAAAGEPFVRAISLVELGNLARHAGQLKTAQDLLERGLAELRHIGHLWGLASMLHAVAALHVQQGRLGEARAEVAEALALFQALGDEWGVIGSLEALAVVVGAQGEVRRAARLLGLVEYRRGSTGGMAWETHGSEADGRDAAGRQDLRDPAFSLQRQAATAATARRALGDAAFALAQAEGRSLPLEVMLADPLPRAGSAPMVQAGPPLTDREREVAVLIAQGLTSPEIAERLVITARTADTHADNIRTKLGLRSRTEIASWATARGLTSADRQHA